MIYLDNAATSFPKPKSVITEVTRCITRYCGNPGRSSHRLAMAAADKIFETREVIADLLNYKKCENVVFTPNATYALNLVIKGLVTDGCHCIVSDLEHNSVLRPLYKSLEKHHGEMSVFDTSKSVADSLIPLIKANTKIIISTLCSNVTGSFINLYDLSGVAKEYGLELILDASQYLGHTPLNLDGIHFTALCSAGHKGLFGIQGSAFAIINCTDLFDTLTEGGSGVDSFSKSMPMLLPERYESGTLPTPAIAGLNAGIRFINEIGIGNIEKRLSDLTSLLRHELSALEDITLYGAESGIASFNLSSYPSSFVSNELDKYAIATRSGFHCAPLIHKKLGTEKTGAVRVSLSYFNTENDIYRLSKALRDIRSY